MQFNPKSLESFRKEFQLTVRELEKKHGIAIKLGGISYSATEFHSKITVVNVDAASSGMSADEIIFKNQLESLGSYYGVEGCYGKVATHHNHTFKLIGIAPKKSKYPLIVREVSTGARYKVASDAWADKFQQSKEFAK